MISNTVVTSRQRRMTVRMAMTMIITIIHKYRLKPIEAGEFSFLILSLINDDNNWSLYLGQVNEI